MERIPPANSTPVPASSPRGPVGGGRGSSGGRHPPNLEVFHFLALLIEVPLPISDPQLWPLSRVRPPPWTDRLGAPGTRPPPLLEEEGQGSTVSYAEPGRPPGWGEGGRGGTGPFSLHLRGEGGAQQLTCLYAAIFNEAGGRGALGVGKGWGEGAWLLFTVYHM